MIETQNEVLTSSDLKDLIQKKGEHLIQNIFANYNYEQKIQAAKQYGLLDENKGAIKYLLSAMAVSIFVNPIGLVTDNGWVIPLSATLVGLVFMYTVSKSFRNKNIAKWFSNSKNLNPLYIFMFKDSVVDEDVLKSFVKVYGNEELVKLLVDKESLSYQDIQIYIAQHERSQDIQNKTNKIREAVDCLSE